MTEDTVNGVQKPHIIDPTIEPKCEDTRCLKTSKAIHYCVDCSSQFCDDCWVLQTPHLPSKRGRDNLPHEKTDPQVYRRFTTILHPPAASVEELQRVHEQDAASKWFGVTKDPASGQLKFNDYGRYASLMSTLSTASSHVQRYPQLVSFVGVTNAGKSTCVRMLISRALAKRKEMSSTPWPAPVVGSASHDSTPTTGDVNLYADPKTLTSTLPILFADCEGFEGGESLPLGAIARRNKEGEGAEDAFAPSITAASHPIRWANTDDTRQREYAVMNLYPRICYTFSDVVVFVLRNPKTFQSSVLTKLLDWGVNSLEKSINQPALPHAIVVLNATDPNVDEREWSVPFATQSLLSSIAGCIDGPDSVPRIQKLAEHWRGMNKSIATIEDLLLQYYSSFQIVRIPSSRYMLLDSQVQKLQTMIEIGCAKSFSAKRKARMLTNGDELNTYFQAGFRHFSSHLNIPFDFVEVSLKNNPIPSDFGGHILQLITRVTASFTRDSERLMWFFEHLSSVLASCIVLDCVRFRKGRIADLFRNYERSVDWALNEFFDMHWPCSYSQMGRRCQLVKARHIKGHQDNTGVISFGDYDPGVSVQNAVGTFKSELTAAMDRIQRDHDYENDDASGSEKVTDHQLALNLHKDYLKRFFGSIGIGPRLFSHASCFVCLMNVPSHPLPCGHVICSACIKAYGQLKGRSTIVIDSCPLHEDLPPWTRWLRPVQIQFKPRGVGTRVLALDGAGMKGIVQLEILREIEEVLGNQIPISCFFDLIVGAGTGAITAAALGIQQKRLSSETIDMFTAICDVAYTPRLGVLPLGMMAPLMPLRARFKTKPMRHAIETAFGKDRKIFGGVESAHDEIKVGMTSVTGAERVGVLLANYHRPDDRSTSYALERPADASLEMDLWEALAAATATPGTFKPFVHEKTHRSYLDASGVNNNPSAVAERERRLIWPDTEDMDPDLFLNLGCGQNRYRIGMKIQEQRSGRRSSVQTTKQTFLQQASNLWSSRATDEVLQAELAWLDFEESLPVSHDPNGNHYLRYNLDLEMDPPRGDDKASLRELRDAVKAKLKLPARQRALAYLGRRLVATSFYFDLKNKTLQADSSYLCTGSIVARFEDGSEYINMLGRFLNTKFSNGHGPYFAVHGDVDDTEPSIIPVERNILERMIYGSKFEIPDVQIRVRNELKPSMISLNLAEQELLGPTGLPISGFPRWLLLDRPPRTVGRDGDRSFRASTQSMASLARAPSHMTRASNESSPRKPSDSVLRNSDDSLAHSKDMPPPAKPEVVPFNPPLEPKSHITKAQLGRASSKASSIDSDGGSQAIDWAYVASLKAARDSDALERMQQHQQQHLERQRHEEQQQLEQQQREQRNSLQATAQAPGEQRQSQHERPHSAQQQTYAQEQRQLTRRPLPTHEASATNGQPDQVKQMRPQSPSSPAPPSPDLGQAHPVNRVSLLGTTIEQSVAVALPVASGKQVQIRSRGKSGGKELMAPPTATPPTSEGAQQGETAGQSTAKPTAPLGPQAGQPMNPIPRNIMQSFPEHRYSVGRDDSPILPRPGSQPLRGGPSPTTTPQIQPVIASTPPPPLPEKSSPTRAPSPPPQAEMAIAPTAAEAPAQAESDDVTEPDSDLASDGEGEDGEEHHFPMEPFFPGKKDDPPETRSPLGRGGSKAKGRKKLLSELPANEEPTRAGSRQSWKKDDDGE